ncbi:MAG TPA: TonB-dependent receptor [Ohtaekwangia sp.]|nr:TonB-dependent receptor [Ohtaekwangia sp.]
MKKEKKVWAMTLIAFWWLAPNLTFAQQDSLAQKTLDEIVVTATKFPKSQTETGKVLTVITEEQLSRSAGKDVSQLLNEQVGLVINGSGSNPGKDKSVYLRGAKTDYTLILIDGIPVNDPSAFGGAFDLRLLPVDQIERIEILKGSQSTLYGSDAIAGVINIITKKKGNNPFGVFGSLAYGSYDTKRGNVGIRGSTKLLEYNVIYSRHKSQGLSEAKDPTGNQNFDKDGFDQQGIQASASIRPVEEWVISPFFRMNEFDGDFDGGSFTDAPSSALTEMKSTGLNSQYNFNKGAVSLQYAYTRSERMYDYTSFKVNYDGRFNHAEIYANYNITDHIQVLGGMNLQHLRMVDESASADTSVLVASPYASFFLRNVNGFSAEIGGRYVNHEQFGNTFTYSINPSYFLNQRWKFFVSYSTAFKAPTLSQLYGQFGANPDLEPERSKHLEGGIHFISSEKKLDVRVTAFKREIDDVILYTNTKGHVNLDEQDDYGVEFEPTFEFNQRFKVALFYAFVTGELTTKIAGTEKDSTYNKLLRRPKHSFGLNTGYRVNDRFYLSINAKTFSDRADQYVDNTDFTRKSVALPGYYFIDLYAEYSMLRNKNIKFFLDLKNITDQDYTEVYGYNTRGINVMAGLSFSF